MDEPALTELDPLVSEIVDALEPNLGKPYALFGHSLGALICFELSRELRRRRLPLPQRLIVAGHGAPHLPRSQSPIHGLSGHEFVARLRNLQGTPEEFFQHPELLALFEPTLRADFQLAETYAFRPEAVLPCPISAYGGLDDDAVSQMDLLGWAEHTDVDFRSKLFPGGHFFLKSAEPLLLRTVARELAESVVTCTGIGKTRV